MKIKMLGHYHGQLNGDRHWRTGEEYEIDDEAGAELVERGRAFEVTEKKTRAAKASANIAETMKANREAAADG